MKTLNPPPATENRRWHPAWRRNRCFCLVALVVLLFSGCNSFGKGKLAEQLQNDNDRLLAEFRAQRDRNEELQQKNRLLEQRIAETEKLLARQFQAGSGRISSLNPGRSSAFSPGLGSDSSSILSPSDLRENDSGAGPAGLQWQPR